VREPGPRSRHLYAEHHQGSMQTPPLDLSQSRMQPLVLMPLSPNDASSMVHSRSSSRSVPATSYDDFSMTLTTTTHSPQQLMAVWNRLLPNESEGPTLISHTALRSRSPFSTSEPRSRIQYTRSHGCTIGAATTKPIRLGAGVGAAKVDPSCAFDSPTPAPTRWDWPHAPAARHAPRPRTMRARAAPRSQPPAGHLASPSQHGP